MNFCLDLSHKKYKIKENYGPLYENMHILSELRAVRQRFFV